MQKMSKERCLYLSMKLWQECVLCNLAVIKQEKHTNIFTIKDLAFFTVALEEKLPEKLVQEIINAHICPCCLYMFQEGEYDPQFDSNARMIAMCKEYCPGMSLWGDYDKEVGDYDDAPCVEEGSPYEVVRLHRRGNHHKIEEIADGFKNLYEEYLEKKG